MDFSGFWELFCGSRQLESPLLLFLNAIATYTAIATRSIVSVMSNLATLAASFTSLDAQKNSINEALSELQALNDSKVVGQLSFVVSSVHGDATDVVDLAVTPSEANLSLSKLKNLVG